MPTYRVVTEFEAPSRREALRSEAARRAPGMAELVEVDGLNERRVAIKSASLEEWVPLAPEEDPGRMPPSAPKTVK